MQATKAGDWKSPPLDLVYEWSLWASVVRVHLFPHILPSSRDGTDNRLWLCVMQVRTLPRQPLYDYARSYKTLSSGAPVIRMLCIKNIQERNCRDSAALCVRLAHNRKVGNFKRGLYLGVAQSGRARVLGARGRRFKSRRSDQSGENVCYPSYTPWGDTLNKVFTDNLFSAAF